MIIRHDAFEIKVSILLNVFIHITLSARLSSDFNLYNWIVL